MGARLLGESSEQIVVDEKTVFFIRYSFTCSDEYSVYFYAFYSFTRSDVTFAS